MFEWSSGLDNFNFQSIKSIATLRLMKARVNGWNTRASDIASIYIEQIKIIKRRHGASLPFSTAFPIW